MFDEIRHLPGYRATEVLYRGERSRVLAGTRLSDGAEVALKILLADETTEKAVMVLARRELELTQRCAGPGIVKVLGLERAGSEPVLVLERVRGGTLRQKIQPQGMPVDSFLALALPLARALARIHRARVVHRDVKPENVLLSPAGDDPVLCDFGIAAPLPWGQDALREPGVLQGSLHYLAPEQTGRMNRGVDMRTDLYALGITFYEMLAGAPPFAGTDPLELVHAHLTQTPRPLDVARGDLPRALAEIVSRLLAKEPDGRYQSGRGLVADLERLQTARREGGTTLEGPLGSADFPDHLVFAPGRLHGRSGVEEVVDQFLREREIGATAVSGGLLLLTGAPGVGKSAQLEVARARAAAAGSRVAAGRFSAHRSAEPYSALREAFASLCHPLLAESEAALAAWRDRIERALGNIGQVVLELVPELTKVIGPQPELQPVGPAEARNRFQVAMRRFVSAFSSAEHPLVLALDDLHHADRGSLQLLEALLADDAGAGLLVIASASVESTAADQPVGALAVSLGEGTRLRRIEIAPLASADVEIWLADLLRLDRTQVAPLAAAVGQKTGNNPLFIQQLLRSLEEAGVLVLGDDGRWRWDLAAVAAAQVPDDLAGLMRAHLSRVGADARRVAGLAAAFGAPHDARTYEAVATAIWPALDIAATLEELTQAGVLARADGSYRLAHPSLREEALQALPTAEQRAARARLGWRMMGAAPLETLAARDDLFAIAEHLRAGHEGTEAAAMPLEERRRLFELFRAAGDRALGSTAYDTAADYLGAAVRVMDDDCWQDLPDRCFAAELGHAKALFLAGRVPEGEEAFARLSGRRLDVLRAAEATATRIGLLTIIGEINRAIDAGLAGLRAVGMRVSRAPGAAPLLVRLLRVLAILRRRDDTTLLAASPARNDEVEAALMLVNATGPAAYWANAKLYLAMHLGSLLLNLRRGYARSIAYAFIRQAMLSAGLLKNFPLAERLGRLALSVQERFPCPQHAPRIAALMAMTVESWYRPLRETATRLPAISKACEEGGDLEYAAYSTSLRIGFLLASGANLRTLREEVAVAARRCKQWGYKDVASVEEASIPLLAVLAGDEAIADPQDPMGMGRLAASEVVAPRYLYSSRGLLPLYLLGHHREGFRRGEETRNFAKDLPGQSIVTEHQFWRGMLAASVAGGGGAEAPLARRRLKELLATFRTYARKCPENNSYRLRLLEAEALRLGGDREEALAAYRDAAEEAARIGWGPSEALAHERRATLLAEMGARAESELFLRQAHDGYRVWGARAKTQQLERDHPVLAERTAAARVASGTGATITSTSQQPLPATVTTTRHRRLGGDSRAVLPEDATLTDGRSLDVGTILGVSQAISEEVTVDAVLRRVLDAALTNAGADRAVLVLRREGVATVEGESVAGGGGFTRLAVPLESFDRLPQAVLRVVERSGERLVLGNAGADELYGRDPHIRSAGVRSLLCTPVVRQGARVGVLYLENSAVSDAFTPERVELLRVLATQAAISLDNAHLYASLEAKVAARTRELDGRNRQMRLVLDNVEQGFLTVDRRGVIADERSAIIHRWLGPCEAGCTLPTYLERTAPEVASALSLGWEALLEDVLPFELALAQLPRRFDIGERSFELAYRPILDDPARDDPAKFQRMLVVISDVTAVLARQRVERAQREVAVLWQHLVRDRTGVAELRHEGAQLVAAIGGDPTPPLVELRRLLHTLKGNAASYGLGTVAELCQSAEADIAELGEAPAPRLAELRARWREVEAMLGAFLGAARRDTVELRREDLADLLAAIRRGAREETLAAMIESWSLEPAAQRLQRVADQVRRLGRSLGKGDVRVIEESNGLRLDPAAWLPFWNALVHVIRNAVDHGLETPEERQAAGKREPPTVTLRTRLDPAGTELVIEVEDDGRGIAWDDIAARARALGLPANNRADLVAALFADGLSTRAQVTEVSGRGVGAAAVRHECEVRGGHVEVQSTPGRGATFSFHFPVSEARRRAARSPTGSHPVLSPRSGSAA
jgi:predicted ATPase/HPt (histidine-containing phosphotransfer) domain-containing protein